jgi:hypothetical protein
LEPISKIEFLEMLKLRILNGTRKDAKEWSVTKRKHHWVSIADYIKYDKIKNPHKYKK